MIRGRRNNKKNDLVVKDFAVDPAATENLLNYNIEGGIEKDEVTKKISIQEDSKPDTI